MRKSKKTRSRYSRRWQKRSTVLMLTINWVTRIPEDGGCTQNTGSVGIWTNLPAYTKPPGIQVSTAWLIALLRSKSSGQSRWSSKVRGLAKWCKTVPVLRMLQPLCRKKGQCWQQLNETQSYHSDEGSKESTRCKMSCCGTFTGINNSFD